MPISLTRLEQAKQLVELDDAFCSAWSTAYTQMNREPEEYIEALIIMDTLADRFGLPVVVPENIDHEALR